MNPTEMKKLMDIVTGTTQYNSMLESIQGDAYRQLYITWYNLGPSLTEARVTRDQVEAIFKAVADGAMAGKNTDDAGASVSNRTMLGKTADVGSKVAAAWDNFKHKIATSGPVSGFDVAFDDVQKKLLSAAGGDSGAIGKALNAYKQFATKYPKMQGAIYAGLIILSGISGWGLGGAAVLAGIRTLDRLLQGDRASSALWKGFKTGALSYGASHLVGQAGPDAGGGGDATTPDGTTPADTTPADTTPADTTPNNVDTSGIPTDGDISKYTIMKGDQLGYIAQANGVSVEDIRGLNPQIDFSQPLQPGMEINLPAQGDGAGSVWQNYRGDMYGDKVPNSAGGTDAVQGASQSPAAPETPTPSGTTPQGDSQLTPKGDNWQNYADASSSAGTTAPYGANMSDEYLKRVIQADENGVKMRFLISPEDAKKALEWKLQNGGTVNNRALGESFNKAKIIRSWKLQESMKLPLQSKLYLTPAGVERIFEAVSRKEMMNEGIWDSVKDTVSKGWETATNKITYNKLMLWWDKNYSSRTDAGEVDTQEVIDFLKRMGVGESLIKQVFSELKIPASPTVSPDSVDPKMSPDVSTGTPATSDATGASSAAASTKPNPNQMAQELKALWDGWREKDASIGAPAVKAQLKDMWMSSGGTNVAEGRKTRR